MHQRRQLKDKKQNIENLLLLLLKKDKSNEKIQGCKRAASIGLFLLIVLTLELLLLNVKTKSRHFTPPTRAGSLPCHTPHDDWAELRVSSGLWNSLTNSVLVCVHKVFNLTSPITTHQEDLNPFHMNNGQHSVPYLAYLTFFYIMPH